MANDPLQTLSNFESLVRAYLRDEPELNRLIEGYETSKRQLRWAIIAVLDDIAESPPPLGRIRIQTVPRMVLLKGVVAEILMSVALWHLRNALRYSDTGVSVDLDKHREYLAFYQILKQEYEAKRDRWKIARNMQLALGVAQGAHSEYYSLASSLLLEGNQI